MSRFDDVNGLFGQFFPEEFRKPITDLQDQLDRNPKDESRWRKLIWYMQLVGNERAERDCRRKMAAALAKPN